MKAEFISRLARLRQIAVEHASRHLAECIDAETAATETLRRHNTAIAAEMLRVKDVTATDPAVEAFGAWLRGARRTQARLIAECERAEVETIRARAELIRARAAQDAINEAQENLAREAAATEHRKTEQRLEETVAFRFATAGHDDPAR